jgi:hypothetical protein
LGRPLAASAHEHWRDAVVDNHCGLVEGHRAGRLIAGRERRRGRSRVTARMVVLRSDPSVFFFSAVGMSIRRDFLRLQLEAIAQLSDQSNYSLNSLLSLPL